ncbi:sigma 54-interacting transcriptional regulator [Klebsiella pneumoniae]|uniref:Sigma 54-interacting transcriptional regulator n=1 Tax=Klebsiella pneumoniae TaxID=573 RepID=A0A939SPX4_KLEPN|nr:sigma 54-interacting transcriptional regulator [Klebsiella pneumoniae]
MIESELFGHEKGAFTGANTVRQGRFEQADGGTLFLDEIGDMPLDVQTRRCACWRMVSFIAWAVTRRSRSMRIIAATHQNSEQRVQEGKFREDLFHRLNVIRCIYHRCASAGKIFHARPPFPADSRPRARR